MANKSNFWLWAERFLLLCVLLLQVAILVNGRGSRPAVDEADDAKAQLAPRPKPFSEGDVPPESVSTAAHVMPARYTPTPPVPLGDPRQEVYSRMGILFEQAVRDLDRLRYMDRSWNSLVASPSMDMRDHGSAYQVTFCLPNRHESQVEVLLKGRLLTVDLPVGQISTGQYQRIRRRLRFPTAVGPHEQATAVLSNGVLRIVVPKCREPIGAPVNVVAHRLM